MPSSSSPLSIRNATLADAYTCAEITVQAYSTLPLYRSSFPRLGDSVPKLIAARTQRYQSTFDAIAAGTSADRFVLVHHSIAKKDIATVRWTIVEKREDGDPEATAQRRIDDLRRTLDELPLNEAIMRASWSASEHRHRTAVDEAVVPLPHMYMHSMATRPEYGGLGAASLALSYVVAEADRQRMPVYLDATRVGAPLYRRFGFETYAVDRVGGEGADGDDFVIEAMIRPAHVIDTADDRS